MPPPHNEIIHMHTLLKNTLTLYREQGDVSLIENLTATDDSVFADPNQMLRVLSNVVVNAVQAIPHGRKGIITISTSNRNGNILIEVNDNGKGISDEEAENVFKPNFTTKSSGMGLGLAISKNIIEIGKGKMWFESRVNQFTSFFIELPVSRSEENTENTFYER
jgi:signal transduction histidine kinase